MSIEMYAFIRTEEIPDRETWQQSIQSLGFTLELDDELDPLTSSGFTPCVIAGQDSGFEIALDQAEELLAFYPHRKDEFAEYDGAISFRWVGDMGELGCSLGSAAALAKNHNAKIYYPDDDLVYETDALVSEAREVIVSLAS